MQTLLRSILTSLYAVYAFAFLILLDPRPQTESREQFVYFVSSSVIMGAAWLLSRWVSARSTVEAIEKQITWLAFYFALAIFLARFEQPFLTGISLALGLLLCSFYVFKPDLPKLFIVLAYAVLLGIAAIFCLDSPLVLVSSFILALLALLWLRRADAKWGLWAILGGIILFPTFDLYLDTPLFAWLFLGIAVVCAVYAFMMIGFLEKLGQRNRGEKSQTVPRYVWDMLIILLIFLTSFDMSLLIDTRHFNFYLAAINNVLQGRTILVDAFSIYGVSMPHIMALPFAFKLLPFTAYAISLLITALTVLEIVAIYGILRALTRSIFWSGLGAALVIIFHLYITAYNFQDVGILPLPQVGVLRFGGLYFLFALSAWRYRLPQYGKWLRGLEYLMLAFIATWSLEALVFLFPAYFAMSVYEILQANQGQWGKSFRPMLQQLGILVLIVGLSWGTYALFAYWRSGQIIQIDVYFAYIFSYGTSNYDYDSVFRIKFWTSWPLLALIFVIFLAALGHYYQDKSFRLPAPLVGILLGGILNFYYWIGNSTILGSQVLAPIILLIYGAWWLQREKQIQRVFNTALLALLLITLFHNLLQTSAPFYSPLGLAFASLRGTNWPEILPIEDDSLVHRDIYRDGGLARPDSIAEAVVEIVADYGLDNKKLMIFVDPDAGISALIYLERSQYFRLTNEYEDALNPLAMERLLEQVPDVALGQRFITMRDWELINNALYPNTINTSKTLLRALCERFGIQEIASHETGVVLLEFVEQSPESACAAYWNMD